MQKLAINSSNKLTRPHTNTHTHALHMKIKKQKTLKIHGQLITLPNIRTSNYKTLTF